jgi:hypothetical protein
MMARRQSFMSGVMEGIQAGIQFKRQQEQDRQARELHDMQVRGLKRSEDAAVESQSAREAIRAAGKVGLVTEEIPGDDGSTTVYRVGNQQFQSKAAANAELAKVNQPLAVARRQYEAAAASGIPELHNQYAAIYAGTRKQTEEDFRSDFRSAYSSGGVQGVLNLYNKQVQDGRQLMAKPVDGGFAVVEYQGGKQVGQPRVFTSGPAGTAEQQFIAQEAQKFLSSPEAYLESYHRDRAFATGVDQFNRKMGQDQSQFDATLRQRGQIAAQDQQVRMAGVGVQRESLNHQKSRDGRPQPMTFMGPDGQAVVAEYAPATGPRQGSLTYLTPQGKPAPVAGAPRGFPQPKADPLADLLGQGAGGPGIEFDTSPEATARFRELLQNR